MACSAGIRVGAGDEAPFSRKCGLGGGLRGRFPGKSLAGAYVRRRTCIEIFPSTWIGLSPHFPHSSPSNARYGRLLGRDPGRPNRLIKLLSLKVTSRAPSRGHFQRNRCLASHAGPANTVHKGHKRRGCVGSRLAGRSGREAKRAAAPGLGESCGAQPRTRLRHEALDLDCPFPSLDRAVDPGLPHSRAKASIGGELTKICLRTQIGVDQGRMLGARRRERGWNPAPRVGGGC